MSKSVIATLLLAFAVPSGSLSAQSETAGPAQENVVAADGALTLSSGVSSDRSAAILELSPIPEGRRSGSGSRSVSPSVATYLRGVPSDILLLETLEPSRLARFAVEYPAPPVPAERDRRGIPYMIVGGALFVGGAIIGDDAGTLLMVGGVAVGAYGLYVYFQ